MKAIFTPTDSGKSYELFQGEDKTLVIESNIDLTAYTEIEFIIDSPEQVTKKLSDSQIANVTTTQFEVTIDAADTEDINQGEYPYQVRGTSAAGKKYHGRPRPNRIKILRSAFVNPLSGNDYG